MRHPGTAAELEPLSESHSASLRRINPLSSGKIAGASFCLGQGLTGQTLGVLAIASPASQNGTEPPCVSIQAVYSALYHSL